MDPGLTIQNVDLDLIDPNPYQPRTQFRKTGMATLAVSMKARGLQQPVVLRENGDRFYLLLGERRMRAARSLGWATIPAIVRAMDDSALRLNAIVENVVREDLDAVEEGRAYRAARDAGESLEFIAAAVGLPEHSIQMKISLVELCVDEVLHVVSIGQLSTTTALHVGRLSPAAQQAVIKRMTSADLKPTEVDGLVEKFYQTENQMELLTSTKRSEPDARVVRQWADVFDSALDAIKKLHELEEQSPGALARAVPNVAVVAERARQLKKEVERVVWKLENATGAQSDGDVPGKDEGA